MKSSIFIILSILLVAEYTYAFPRPKLSIRHSALRVPRSLVDSSEEALGEHDKLALFAINQFEDFVQHTVNSHKTFFNNVVKSANDATLNTPSFREQLKQFSDFSTKVDDLKGKDGEERLEKLFDLFSECIDLTDKYDLDELKNPTEEERLIGRLLNENGNFFINLEFIGQISNMRTRTIERVQNYIDSLSEQERKQESKLIRYLNKLKNEQDITKYLDLVMELIEMKD